jgi:hypothetical protein
MEPPLPADSLLLQLAFAAIVAGLTGDYLHSTQGTSAWDNGRFIYTEVVAGLSILLAIIWLFPFSGSFIHWPADLFISVCWWVAFGLLVNHVNGSDGACGGVFDWSNVSFHGDANTCGKWKADIAFSFLSALLWLVSGLLGIYWVHRHNRTAATTTTTRRRWYRRSRV